MLVSREPCGLARRISDDSVAKAAPEATDNGGGDIGLYSAQEGGNDKADRTPTNSDDSLKAASRPLEVEVESFSLYLAAIGEIPLLTPEGERALGRDMQMAREAMTGALAHVPVAVRQFLEAYASARNNQWELGQVVIPSPQTAEQHSALAVRGDNLSSSPMPDKATIGSLLEALSAHYARWSAYPAAGGGGSLREKLALRQAMVQTFAALPIAPKMLGKLYATSQALNERRTTIERRLATAVGFAVDCRDSAPLFTSESLRNWLLELRFAPYRELLRAAQHDLRQLEVAAGTDVTSLYQAHTEALAAWRRYRRAWSQLVEANLRLVIAIARHFVRDGITLADLVQEGNLGLFRASEKFDYRLGYRFSTYASFWIRQAVSRALPKQGRLITVPRYMYDHISRLGALAANLQQQLARNPSIEELTAAASLPADTVLTALGADQGVFSLDSSANEEEGSGLYDRLADQHQPDPADSLNDAQITKRVADLLKTLPEREALILRLHYGIGGACPITLEQIAGILGITRERVRQLEVHALRVLRSRDAVELFQSLEDGPGNA